MEITFYAESLDLKQNSKVGPSGVIVVTAIIDSPEDILDNFSARDILKNFDAEVLMSEMTEKDIINYCNSKGWLDK
jgi:hypothetical protein